MELRKHPRPKRYLHTSDGKRVWRYKRLTWRDDLGRRVVSPVPWWKPAWLFAYHQATWTGWYRYPYGESRLEQRRHFIDASQIVVKGTASQDTM